MTDIQKQRRRGERGKTKRLRLLFELYDIDEGKWVTGKYSRYSDIMDFMRVNYPDLAENLSVYVLSNVCNGRGKNKRHWIKISNI